MVESTKMFMDFSHNNNFKIILENLIDSAEHNYSSNLNLDHYRDGFILYRKYSRKDVFRILNWSENPVSLNVGGYLISSNDSVCPIFLTYQKDEDIPHSTKYEDRFITNRLVEYVSKSNRRLNSKDVQTLGNQRKNNINIPLFVNKE